MEAETKASVRVSVVVPVFEEAVGIERSLRRLAEHLDDLGIEHELVCVDDGSRDRTPAALTRAAARDGRVRVLRLRSNRGKGAAVRAGVLAAAGEHVLFTDADLSTDLAATAEVLAALETGTPVVFGSRRAPGARIERPQGPLRAGLGRVFTALARLAGGHALRDVTCGFKGFTRPAARELFGRARVDGWAFDAELAAIARARGLAVRELGVVWRDGEHSSVRVLPAAARALLDLTLVAARRLGGAWTAPLAGPVGGGLADEDRSGVQAAGPAPPTSDSGPRSLVGDGELAARPPQGPR